jgi:hypothetical protein
MKSNEGFGEQWNLGSWTVRLMAHERYLGKLLLSQRTFWETR